MARSVSPRISWRAAPGRMAVWMAGPGWLASRAGWLAGLAGWLAARLAGWLAGLAGWHRCQGWLAGLDSQAGWLARLAQLTKLLGSSAELG